MVIGSQAVPGTWHEDDLPPQAVQSFEVDMAPLTEDAADPLDAFLGEFSPFHETRLVEALSCSNASIRWTPPIHEREHRSPVN